MYGRHLLHLAPERAQLANDRGLHCASLLIQFHSAMALQDLNRHEALPLSHNLTLSDPSYVLVLRGAVSLAPDHFFNDRCSSLGTC